MKNQILSFKAATYERMYKEYFKDINNKTMQLHIWFRADRVDKVKIS